MYQSLVQETQIQAEHHPCTKTHHKLKNKIKAEAWQLCYVLQTSEHTKWLFVYFIISSTWDDFAIKMEPMCKLELTSLLVANR